MDADILDALVILVVLAVVTFLICYAIGSAFDP